MTADDPLPGNALVKAVNRLETSINHLARRSDVQEESLKRNRMVLRIALVGLALDLALTVVCAALFAKADTNSEQIQSVQDRTSSEVLCPLYQVFLDSMRINTPPANQTPEQAEFRAESMRTIQHGYDILKCSEGPQ